MMRKASLNPTADQTFEVVGSMSCMTSSIWGTLRTVTRSEVSSVAQRI